MSRTQQKDNAIIQAATTLFTELGLDRVTVEDIAKAANVSKPTIYTRYETKEKLYVTVLITECEKQIERMFGYRQPEQTIDDFIFEKVHEYLAFVVDPKQTNLFKNAIFYTDRFKEIGEAFMHHGPMKGRQKLAYALAAEMKSGELDDVDPINAADFILSRCKGVAFFSALFAPQHVDFDAQNQREAKIITNEFLKLYASKAS